MNGTLNLSYASETFDTLTGSGTVTTTLTYSPGLTLGSNNGSCEFDGVIQNGSSPVSFGKAARAR